MKRVTLMGADLFINDSINLGDVSVAEDIRWFGTGFDTSRHNERGWETVSFRRSFIQWILYIGAKYQKLQHLALQDIHLQTLDEIVIGPLLTAVSKLAHLRSYSVQICSLSRQLVEAMTANNLQSDDLGFILQENDPINETFDPLRLSTSFSTLASITLVCYPGVSLPLLCQTPVPLFNISGHLTRLTLTCYDDSAEHSTGLFINILQNQAALESLYFRFMTMKEDGYSVLSRQIPDIRRGRIKSIKLRINAIGGEQNAAENLNRIFNFTLQSCPLLNIFRLFCPSSIRSRGAINLDFTRHQYLQEIEFDIKKCRYYTFGHEFGKYWRAVNDEILHDFTLEQEIAFPFYVNMAWDTTKKMDVHLAGCGV